MSIIFLESSAIARVLLQQDDWQMIRDEIREAERLIASRLLQVELFRIIQRLGSLPEMAEETLDHMEHDVRTLLAVTDLYELTREVCELASQIQPRSHLRTLDALHVASYSLLKSRMPSIRMLTRDARIAACL